MGTNTPTIAAISTPQGAGAVGMVRLSGAQSLKIAEKVFRPSDTNVRLSKMRGYSGALGRAVEADGSQVDDVILFIYRAPKSYTGEDVAELCCHGGSFAVRRVLRLCLDAGARPAEPGEFTKRAFINGKLDLSQAEAVMDLVGAQGEASMRAALALRDGTLSAAVDSICAILLEQTSHLAAWADYPEEDIIPVDEGELALALEGIASDIRKLLGTYDRGRLLRQGASAVIVGKPNVGKSTLMNLLSGYPRSIVADVPGTTRDIVQDTVTLGGVALNLMDTAGIRDSMDEVEREGVARTLTQIEAADLILAVFDRSAPLDERDRRLLDSLKGKNCVAVLNKCDLPSRLDSGEIEKAIPDPVYISACNGDGRDELETRAARALELDSMDTSAALVANERQRLCLQDALDCVQDALDALSARMTLDAVNVCIDCALDALFSLTGRRVPDAVVDEVFSRFCVGK